MKIKEFYIIIFTFIFFILTNHAYPDTPTKKQEVFPFRLMGTVVELNPGKSLAVIKDLRTQKQGIYRIGDKFDGSQILIIVRGRAILFKAGKISFLDLPLGSDLEPVVVISEKERIINRNAVLREINNLNVAIAQARPIPQIEAGKFIGFKITGLDNKGLAEMAGIKKGDVVTTVNGNKINSIQGALETYYRVRAKPKISLEIKRGAEVKNLIYYIN